jgi:zinc protease
MRVMPSRTLVGSLAIALLVAGPAPGCAHKDKAGTAELPRPSRNLVVPGDGFLKVYDNGLQLFVVPDPFTRLVEFDVRHRVGSREDPAGKGGMAHFVEHLMFQLPSDGAGSAKLMSTLPQHTLFFNAYTASDETHYMHTGTADELETYTKYTALRLGYDCDSVDENSFLREREVVRNEHRWRGQGVDVFVLDSITELAFPDGHPYRQKVLGEDKDLASITPKDACDFIRRYYTASQASVIVTGDVDPHDVLQLANEYLAPLPKVEAPARTPVPPASFAKQHAEIEAPVKKPTAIILFRMPKRFTPEYAASQAAIETMFLSVAFFVGQKGSESVVERFYPAFLGGKEASLFGVGVETKKARDLDRAVDEVLDAVTRGFAPKLKGKDHKSTYDSARQRARLAVLDAYATPLSRAIAFADYLEEGANPGFAGKELAALDDLTSERAQQIGRKLFAREGAMVVEVVPDGSKDKPKAERAAFDYQPKTEENLSIPDDIDPAEAHEPLPITDIAPPEGASVELDLENGMHVVLVQSSQMPVIDVQLIVSAGTLDSPSQPDLADMAARFYDVGDDRVAMNLMQSFDMAGGIYFGDAGALSTTFRSRGLAIYLDFIIAGLGERVVQGEYRDGALEGWKQNRKEQLKKQSQRQQAERLNVFNTALYGAGHPHVQAVITDAKKLKDIGLRDLDGFRRKHYRADGSAIIVTGGFDMDLALKYIEAYFGKPNLRDPKATWLDRGAKAARPKPPPPKPGATRTITEIDKERVQTDVTIAYPLAEAYGDDHAALAVLADMLNFEVSVVRMELGASYGVYGRLDTERPRIEVGGAIDSARGSEGLTAIRAAIQRLRDGRDFDRRFAFARRNVLREMINAQADPQLLAGQLAQAVRNGRSYDYFQELARRVATLTPAQVKAQIERVLVDSRAVTMIQGPADGVADILAKHEITGAKRLPDVVHEDEEE